MYDPSVGRFLEEDPIGFTAGDANLYRYVGNDPTDLSDPSGLDSSGQNPGMQDQRRYEMYQKILEEDQLRQEFPRGIQPFLEKAQQLQRDLEARQANYLKELEKRVKILEADQKRYNDQRIKEMIDEQISLQKKMIELQKINMARQAQQIQIIKQVNATDINKQQEIKALELDFLRILRSQQDYASDFVRAQQRIEDIYKEIEKELRPGK